MAKVRHRRFDFVRARVAVLALGVSIFVLAAPASGQASGATHSGEGDVTANSATSEIGHYVTRDQVINLCEWEPMSCEPECMIEPWYCGVREPCWFEPWYCAEEEVTVNIKKYGSGSGVVTSSPAGISCGLDCSGQFPEGMVITLTAKADKGSKFAGWSGGGTGVSSACSGTDTCKITLVFIRPALYPPPPLPPVSVTATFDLESKPNLDLTVSKTGAGLGTVASSPVGIDCGGTCTAEFEEGKEVTLSASAEPDSVFSGWSGAGCSGTDTCKVTMTEAKSVTATFSLEQPSPNEAKTLSVQKVGSGLGMVKSSPVGISCMAACDSAKLRFSGDTPVKEVTLTASPSKSSTFVAWGGDCAGSALTCKLTLSADKSVTAEFASIPKVDLTLNKVSGTGTVKSSPASINCAVACSTQTSGFYEGSEVTLTAIPYKSTFVQWTGACSGSSPTCKVTMSEAWAVGAEFTGTTVGTVPLTLTKTAGSTGTGKVQVYGGRINCDANCTASTAVLKPGAKVVLKQTPSMGSTFVGWGGACSGSGVCEVMLSEAKEATAEFKAVPANALTVNKAGGGRGTVKSKPAGVNCGLICSQTVALFPQTASVTLMAVPGQGFGPVQWIGCDEVTGELCVVAMDSAKEVTAKFE